jgi:hypothetical protein
MEAAMDLETVPLGTEARMREVDKAAEGVRSILDHMGSDPAVQAFGQQLIDAMHFFGECELIITSSEKEALLRPRSRPVVDLKRAEAMEANDLGLRLLASARQSLRDDESEDVEIDGDARQTIDLLGARFRRCLVTMPLTVEDTQEVWSLWQEAAAARSIHGLRDYVLGRADQLDEFRRSDTRGTEHGIPWWKVAAIAAIVGIFVWGVICCLFRVCGCPVWAMAAANIVLAVAVWVLWYC